MTGLISLPSNSRPPPAKCDTNKFLFMSSFGQSLSGFSNLVEGPHNLTTPVLERFFRCIKSLIRCVVPTIIKSMFFLSILLISFSIHNLTAVLTSSEVLVLKELITLLELSIRTPSVFVPPTSIPILIIFSACLINIHNQSHTQNLLARQLLMLYLYTDYQVQETLTLKL